MHRLAQNDFTGKRLHTNTHRLALSFVSRSHTRVKEKKSAAGVPLTDRGNHGTRGGGERGNGCQRRQKRSNQSAKVARKQERMRLQEAKKSGTTIASKSPEEREQRSKQTEQ